MKIKILCAIFLFTVAGCAHTSKEVDEKISAEPPVKNSEELAVKARALINSNPNINLEQKSKLFELQDKIRSELMALQEENLKIRALLIQEITSDDYRESKAIVIKNRLKKNENKKLLTYFNAVDEANEILGRENEQEKRLELMRNTVDIHYRY